MSTENARGRFVWHDLLTTDPEAAKAFYTAVVGWGTTIWDQMDPPYTMWTAGEKPIGGILQKPAEALAAGAKPEWLAYVTVPDVDATIARAQELGGKVMAPPRDIPTVGRFAVLADPQGAFIAPYTPQNEQPEADGMPPLGDFSWHELATTDHEAAFAFYSDLFGWEKTNAMDMGPAGVYQMYGRNGQTLGGMYNKAAGTPGSPAWLHYARVADVNVSAEKTKALGGQVINGPMEVPGGDWIVMGIDPQGGPFAVHQVGAPASR